MRGNLMSFDLTITTEEQIHPPRLFVYGGEGAGKTTFAASAPGPIFLRTEDGIVKLKDPYSSKPLHPARLPVCQNMGHVFACLNKVYQEAAGYQTMVIDTADWLEKLIHAEILQETGAKAMAKAHGGWGAGFQAALKKWGEVFGWINAIHSRGLAIILLGHADVEKFESPDLPSFDRWVPRLHKLSRALITEWADAVLFATQKSRVKEMEDGRLAGTSGVIDERVLKTTLHPTVVAKNRYHLPPEIPLRWSEFEKFLMA
jgi:hypothetical protein